MRGVGWIGRGGGGRLRGVGERGAVGGVVYMCVGEGVGIVYM